MGLTDLTTIEIAALGRALQLMAKGQLVDEIEFHTRMGIELDDLRKLLLNWPNWNDRSDDSSECLAINNTLNDLLHGVGINDNQCQKEIGISRNELERIYDKWASARGWGSTGIR